MPCSIVGKKTGDLDAVADHNQAIMLDPSLSDKA
jgi:hypothetical protein